MAKKLEKIAIIGGGASGLLSSILLSKKGYDVTLYEKNNKVGKKILASGNGRCNISNSNIDINFYHSKNRDLVKSAILDFNSINFFKTLGLTLVEGKNSRLYPMSLQSSTVVELLYFHAKNSGVKFYLSCMVDNIARVDEKFLVEDLLYDKLVIATGSPAMPKLGSSDSGYKFAKIFNHKIIPVLPSLVQLISKSNFALFSSGVKVDALLKLHVNKENKREIRGDLLFTNYGLSGSAILDISLDVAKALYDKKEVIIKVDLFPQFSVEQFKSFLLSRLDNHIPLELWLNTFLHKKLIKSVLKNAKIVETYPNRKVVNKLSFYLKNIEFCITKTRGLEHCEVVSGGVDLADINTKTFESKLVKNLYFCGEVLDVVGECGGYNMHFAWASAYSLAKNIG